MIAFASHSSSSFNLRFAIAALPRLLEHLESKEAHEFGEVRLDAAVQLPDTGIQRSCLKGTVPVKAERYLK